MKFQLDKPFLEDFKAAYLNINKEPRRVVLFVRKDNSKTSMSYARYLMSCKLGRFLNKTEHVDHKDDNSLNDVISNLQILTPKENNIKKNKNLGIKLQEDITLECPVCNDKFTRPARNIKWKLDKGKRPTCSIKCGGIWGQRKK